MGMSKASKRLLYLAFVLIALAFYLGQHLAADSHLNGFFESTRIACGSYAEVKASSACAEAEKIIGNEGSVSKSNIDLLKYLYWSASLLSLIVVAAIPFMERNGV